MKVKPPGSRDETEIIETHRDATPSVIEGDETGAQINHILKALSQHINEIDGGRRDEVDQPEESVQDASSVYDTTAVVDKESGTRTDEGLVRKQSTVDGLYGDSEIRNDVDEQDENDSDDASDDDDTIVEEDQGAYSSGNDEENETSQDWDNNADEHPQDGKCKKGAARKSRATVIKSPRVETDSVPCHRTSHEQSKVDDKKSTYVVFEFDPNDVDQEERNNELQTKKQRIIALPRPFGKSQRQLKSGKKLSKSKAKQAEDKKKSQKQNPDRIRRPRRNLLEELPDVS